jgi:hypothetical protein
MKTEEIHSFCRRGVATNAICKYAIGNMKNILPFIAVIFVLVSTAGAYMNVTYLNTTIILNQNTSAHVVEVLDVYISNSSIPIYLQDRAALNFTLTRWQQALNTPLLVEHILPPRSSVMHFSFLPGPVQQFSDFGIAKLTFEYDVDNVTTMRIIAPRTLQYSFNDGVFNFINTANGQALPQNTRLNIILPSGASVIAVYPLPDMPVLSFIKNYTNVQSMSWYNSEPLSKFTLTYLVKQSLETEVIQYFQNILDNYWIPIAAAVILAIILFFAYFYAKTQKHG